MYTLDAGLKQAIRRWGAQRDAAAVRHSEGCSDYSSTSDEMLHCREYVDHLHREILEHQEEHQQDWLAAVDPDGR